MSNPLDISTCLHTQKGRSSTTPLRITKTLAESNTKHTRLQVDRTHKNTTAQRKHTRTERGRKAAAVRNATTTVLSSTFVRVCVNACGCVNACAELCAFFVCELSHRESVRKSSARKIRRKTTFSDTDEKRLHRRKVVSLYMVQVDGGNGPLTSAIVPPLSCCQNAQKCTFSLFCLFALPMCSLMFFRVSACAAPIRTQKQTQKSFSVFFKKKDVFHFVKELQAGKSEKCFFSIFQKKGCFSFP